jgi:molybdate transport system substrate-binding protein
MPRPSELWRAAVCVGLMGAAAMAQADELRVHSAGSLRAALTEAARAFEAARPALKLVLVFGASGLLKDRLLGGERTDVFASANMAHPAALAQAGLATVPVAFASNRLCVLAGPGFDANADSVVTRLLDPTVRIGTSTPKADPAGDYTWAMFERIEQQGRPGAFKTLSTKALQLTGGPNSPPPPEGRNVYGALMASGQADVFITYCTNAVVAQAEEPALRRIELPAAVNVSALYGITVMNDSPEAARDFVTFLRGPAGQALLAQPGFSAP